MFLFLFNVILNRIIGIMIIVILIFMNNHHYHHHNKKHKLKIVLCPVGSFLE